MKGRKRFKSKGAAGLNVETRRVVMGVGYSGVVGSALSDTLRESKGRMREESASLPNPYKISAPLRLPFSAPLPALRPNSSMESMR